MIINGGASGVSPLANQPMNGQRWSARLSCLLSSAKAIKFDPFLELKLRPDKETRNFSKFLIFERSAIVRLHDADGGKRARLYQAIYAMLKNMQSRFTGNEAPIEVLNSYVTGLPATVNAHKDAGLAVVNVQMVFEGRPVTVPVIYAPSIFKVKGTGKHLVVFADDQWGMAEVAWPHPLKTAKLKYQHGIDEEAGRILEKLCRKFQCRILLRNPKDHTKTVYVDEIDQAKSRSEVQVDRQIINSVVLGIGHEGDIIIEAIGPDADKAMVEVVNFIESPVENYI